MNVVKFYLKNKGGNKLIIKNDKQFNMFPSHVGLRKYIQYYNIVFPSNDMFVAHYTLMPNACGTLSLAFDGNTVIAELWGASLTPVLLGVEPNGYRVLLLIQLSPSGCIKSHVRVKRSLQANVFLLRILTANFFSHYLRRS